MNRPPAVTAPRWLPAKDVGSPEPIEGPASSLMPSTGAVPPAATSTISSGLVAVSREAHLLPSPWDEITASEMVPSADTKAEPRSTSYQLPELTAPNDTTDEPLVAGAVL
jgi:hypothetical protein